jgi:hypothetical protein
MKYLQYPPLEKARYKKAWYTPTDIKTEGHFPSLHLQQHSAMLSEPAKASAKARILDD